MKKIFIVPCLTLCVIACGSACVSSRSTPDTAKAALTPTAERPPAGCIAATATRIPVSPKDCAAFGRVWTDQDIRSTGATDAAQALRQLDPTSH